MQELTEEKRHELQIDTLSRFIALLINVAVEESVDPRRHE